MQIYLLAYQPVRKPRTGDCRGGAFTLETRMLAQVHGHSRGQRVLSEFSGVRVCACIYVC